MISVALHAATCFSSGFSRLREDHKELRTLGGAGRGFQRYRAANIADLYDGDSKITQSTKPWKAPKALNEGPYGPESPYGTKGA
jgi:hypothetical protein